MHNSKQTATPDLLSVFDGIEPGGGTGTGTGNNFGAGSEALSGAGNNGLGYGSGPDASALRTAEDVIAPRDTAYCEQQQQALHATLDQIDRWYGLFREDATRYETSHRPEFAINGLVRRSHVPRPEADGYSHWEFRPFEAMDKLAEQRLKAIYDFGCNIVGYFNRTYGVSVPEPEFDRDKTPVDFRPVYQTCVDTVLAHLGGRSFRSVAEAELLSQVHRLLRPSKWRENDKRFELNGNVISLFRALCYDEAFRRQDKTLWLDSRHDATLATLCDAIVFGATSSVRGRETNSHAAITSLMLNLDVRHVDASRRYDLEATARPAVAVKFYKNGRMDIRFTDAYSAGRCYRRLGLDTLRAEEQ
jgi:hypothetical protein